MNYQTTPDLNTMAFIQQIPLDGELTDSERLQLIDCLADGAADYTDFWEYFNDNNTLTPWQTGGYGKRPAWIEGGSRMFTDACKNCDRVMHRDDIGRMFAAEYKASAWAWAAEVVERFLDDIVQPAGGDE